LAQAQAQAQSAGPRGRRRAQGGTGRYGPLCPQPLEEVTVAAVGSGELGQLADDDGQSHAEQEADQGVFGEEVRRCR
jgi:hypothetical protein